MADRRPQLRSSPRSHGGSELQSYAAGKRQKPQETRLRLNKRGINRSAALWALCRCRHKGHWTGAEKRLNRDSLRGYAKKEERAREELVAEIGAVMAGMRLGLQAQPREDNASYIQGWVKLLEDKPAAIFEAASAAGRAVNYLAELKPNAVSNTTTDVREVEMA